MNSRTALEASRTKTHTLGVTENAAGARDRQRWLHRLAVAADPAQPERVRLAAIRSIQEVLHTINPLKHIPDRTLLQRIKLPWECRLYKDKFGQLFEAYVSRPPVELTDIWD